MFLWVLCAVGLGLANGFVFPASMALSVPRSLKQKPDTCPPFIIMPGFGNDAVDYVNPLGKGEDIGFLAALRRRDIDAYVVPVNRWDWLNVLKGLLSLSFWTGTITPYEPPYGWYLDKVTETVERAQKETGSSKVILVGHSAGGWLARAAMGDGYWGGRRSTSSSSNNTLSDDDVVDGGAGIEGSGRLTEETVAGLVSLGTPHILGPMDMTRGALTYVHNEYPGAFLKDRGIFYISVAGTAVEGVQEAPREDPRRFAYNSYETVCGVGSTVGDGCVPLRSAHLYENMDATDQVTLPGVYHSVNAPTQWYGSEDVVDQWLECVYSRIKEQQQQSSAASASAASSGTGAGMLEEMMSFWKRR